MFCNRLLLTRNDRLPFDIISAAAKAIHPLTPFVDVLAVSWENVELSTLLALTEYNFDRVDLLISELEALNFIHCGETVARTSQISYYTVGA